MSKCVQCGLFSPMQKECIWFKKILTQPDIEASVDCTYFTEIMYEDGEPLTPYQHLMLKRQDIDSKKMQGPV